MGKPKKEVVVVSKIKPYPIPINIWISDTTPPIQGDILRLTKIGFQMEIQSTMLQIGHQYKVEFTLPSFNKTITEQIKIIKTMDHFKDSKATVKGYLIEMHFLALSKENEKSIINFETAIRQKI